MNTEYVSLRFASACFEDARRQVVRIKNRTRAAERNGWKDPVLDEALGTAEAFLKGQEKMLVSQFRATAPELIRQFQHDTIGLGEAGMARLVGIIGDFKVYTKAWWETSGDDGGDGGDKRVLVTADEPTTCGVRDVWAFCGMAPGRKRGKGKAQEENFAAGNPRAKDAAWQIAKAIVYKRESPYRKVYDTAKANAETKHPDWTKGHCDQHAIRLTAKALLKDLWRIQHGYPAVFGAQTPWTPRKEAA